MYDEFYGFSARPFQLTPDAAFYFESLTHRKALSYLGYGLAQGEGFIVITGEVGAGKSTLVAHLMATIDPQRLTAAQVVTSALNGEEIIHVVAQAFGLVIDGHDKASALAAIEGLLHAEARGGRRCLLVVDEAQNLSIEAIEELRMLSNFQLGAQPLLQTLLLGQPEFRDLLQSSPELEQLRQRVIATHHLDAMEADEIRPYIEHRLKLVGWEGRPQIAADVYPALYEASGGVPRRVNQIANRLFLMGSVEQRDLFDADLFARVLAEVRTDTGLAPAREVVHPQFSPPAPPMAHPAVAPEPIDAVPFEEMKAAFAERDALISELQQAVIELANSVEQPAPAAAVPSAELTALAQRLGAMEQRLVQQEASVKHALAMLIEWLEADQKAAA
ncbi:AAA family ATPase [Novosphingobium flavum]|uniref:AAA family ATPase n=1 Tax=Novosphingobium flavum TaxID=1778672 RepID=A0A7X1FTV4_9SPHN|nr:XrtA/PEP-CTERM system-associated ATPase [Novosphingobium flavum]MBC2666347.1 AAA family ATPase [Novosphingobium flavum]